MVAEARRKVVAVRYGNHCNGMRVYVKNVRDEWLGQHAQ